MAITQTSLKNLIPKSSQWRHQPTKALRVPECFVPEIEAYAIQLDRQDDNVGEVSLNSRILGIKPSISQLGWSILEHNDDFPLLLDFGVIETDSKMTLPQRLEEIVTDLQELSQQFYPAQVFIEQPFINPEHSLAMSKSLQALGVINFAVSRYCGVLPTMIYSASWKAHIDSPKANREDIAEVLEQLFDLESLTLNNGVDAIAIAYGGYCGVGVES